MSYVNGWRSENNNFYSLQGWALEVFLPVAPSLFSVEVDVSGRCKAVACFLTTVEVQSIALRLAGMLNKLKSGFQTGNLTFSKC